MVASKWDAFGFLEQWRVPALCPSQTLQLSLSIPLCPLTLEVNHKCLLTGKGIFLGLQHKMIATSREGGKGRSVWPVRIQSFTLAPQCGRLAVNLSEMQNGVPLQTC